MSENVFAQFGLSAEQMIATQKGINILSGKAAPRDVDPGLVLGLVQDFSNEPEDFDKIFEEYGTTNGLQSQIYIVGDSLGSLVIKVSAPDTVIGIPSDERPLQPEDLILQMMFENSLREFLNLGENASLNISAPEHFFGMNVNDSYGLNIMRFVWDHTSLEEIIYHMLEKGTIDNDTSENILFDIADRIYDATDGTIYEEALGDLFPIPDDKDHHDVQLIAGVIRANNVLANPLASPRLLPHSNLYIIDEPPKFEPYRGAAQLAVATATNHPKYYRYETS